MCCDDLRTFPASCTSPGSLPSLPPCSSCLLCDLFSSPASLPPCLPVYPIILASETEAANAAAIAAELMWTNLAEAAIATGIATGVTRAQAALAAAQADTLALRAKIAALQKKDECIQRD